MRRTLGVVALLSFAAAPALADRPLTLLHPYHGKVNTEPFLISHIVYINNCANGSCKVTPGGTDSRTQTSDIAQAPGTLSAYTGNWSSLKACIENEMSPFNIQVVDTDPGPSVDHFEIMIGGSPQQIGLGNGIGGIADYACAAPGACAPGTYLQNAVVFDFAAVWGNDVNQTCATAAQEIAHTWTLDHAIPNNDPMTYNKLSSSFMYQNNAPCGSDCQYSCPSGSGQCDAFGVQCTANGTNCDDFGNGTNDCTHLCLSTGTATQNEVDIITNLFGPAGAQAPTVKFTSPGNGDAVQSGQTFPIDVECDTSDGVMEVDLEIDGVATATLTSSPAMFTGPSTLKDGTHTLNAVCGTNKKASSQSSIQIVIGDKCNTSSDCSNNGICYMGACIPGPNATGGLGATCTASTDCASGECGNDDGQMLCVIPCNPSNDQCPSGFGCLGVSGSSTNGVCWLGASHGGGGGCSAGGSGAGGLLFGLSALLITRRRRAQTNP